MTTLLQSEEHLRGLPPIIDVPTAAVALGIGRATAYRLIAAGEWPTPVLRFGRHIRISRAALLSFIGLEP